MIVYIGNVYHQEFNFFCKKRIKKMSLAYKCAVFASILVLLLLQTEMLSYYAWFILNFEKIFKIYVYFTSYFLKIF